MNYVCIMKFTLILVISPKNLDLFSNCGININANILEHVNFSPSLVINAHFCLCTNHSNNNICKEFKTKYVCKYKFIITN